jgi:5'-nucleotidase
MEESIIISNPEKLEKIKKLISRDGAENFFIVSDFDRTLTTAFVNGKNTPSLLSILRDGNYLTPGYAEKAHALYNKYHPIEIDPSIEKEQNARVVDDPF